VGTVAQCSQYSRLFDCIGPFSSVKTALRPASSSTQFSYFTDRSKERTTPYTTVTNDLMILFRWIKWGMSWLCISKIAREMAINKKYQFCHFVVLYWKSITFYKIESFWSYLQPFLCYKDIEYLIFILSTLTSGRANSLYSWSFLSYNTCTYLYSVNNIKYNHIVYNFLLKALFQANYVFEAALNKRHVECKFWNFFAVKFFLIPLKT
jgi:hypothetical protein